MTRETKAGLVVSCSFLCLVGIVLFSKLREAPTPGTVGDDSTEPTLASAPEEPQPIKEVKTEPVAEIKDLAKAALAQQNEKRHTEGKVLPAAYNVEETASNLAGTKTAPAQPSQKGLTPPSFEQQENGGLAIEDTSPLLEIEKEKGNLAAPATPSGPAFLVAQPSARTRKASILTWVPDRLKKQATSLQGMGLRSPAGADTTRLASQTQPANDGLSNALQNAAGNTRPRLEPPSLSQLETTQPEPKREPLRTSQPVIVGMSVKPAPNTTGTASVPGLSSAALSDLGNNASESTLPPLAAIGNNKKVGEAAATTTPAAEQGNAGRGGLVGTMAPANVSEQDRTLTQSPVDTQSRVPAPVQSGNHEADNGAARGVRLDAPTALANQVAQGQSSPSTSPASNEGSPIRTHSPLGAPIPVVSPMVAPMLPANTSLASAPQVESYDEDTYTCRANDTFRSISQAVYRTEAYDQALLLFNRNHPLAGDALRQSPPLLQPGQPVFIPPLQILRKYYAASISDTRDLTPARSEAPAAQQAVALTPPLNAAAPTAATARTYRVGASGEMFRDVARRTLGNADRWTEIYQLNSSYDPTHTVPAGTELRLPADAHVDAQ